ncbi:MAG: bifunctional 3'-5' exonuclease/DNA polymerase [Chloroflexi bacterium]|nr:bifunctional 3'-5' exonuclease/DNA polymerase [Chloroflexota bacterium]
MTFRIQHTPARQERGHWYSTIKAHDGDTILHAETVRLDDPLSRDVFALRVVAASNGSAPDKERLRHELLRILDGATAEKSGGGDADTEKKPESQATRMVAIALAAADLFHDDRDDPYARLTIGNHTETWLTHAKRFKLWLAGRFYHEYNTAAGAQAIADALNVIDAKARFDGPCRPVFLRLAPDGLGGVYLDLVDDEWRAVHITPAGWRIVHRPPVYFRRSPGMLPLPEPQQGGSLDDLRALVNVPDDADWAQVVAWLRGALHPSGPYPVLALKGEQGSAKTTLARMLRLLVDPAKPELRSDPRELRDVAIAARNNWIVAFDNVSYIEPWLSDVLCRLSTGAGWATRELYTDVDETLFEARRPALLNGITEFITRPDLLDRTIQIVLPQIADDDRRQEKELWPAFEVLRPRLLGAILDSAVGALRIQSSVHLGRLPRMADFATWAVAAERAAGEPTRFLEAYTRARAESNAQAIDGSLIGQAIQKYIVPGLETGPWRGTATEVLDHLSGLVDDRTKRERHWPRTGRALASELRRLGPAFRAVGVRIVLGERGGHRGARIITLTLDNPGGRPSASSAEPDDQENQSETADDSPGAIRQQSSASSADRQQDDEVLTIADDADGADDLAVGNRQQESPVKSTQNGPADDADDVPPTFSKDTPFRSPIGDLRVQVITTADGLSAVLPDLLAAPMLGLDTETTGLDWQTDRLRLVQFATPERTYVIDCFRVDPKALAPIFDGGRVLVGHNLKFDLHFIAGAGLPVPTGERLFDTMIAAQLLGAGTDDGRLSRCGLKAVAKRYLDADVDKTEQKADWSGPLSDEQIRYAALDAAILLPLHDKLTAALAEDGAKLGRVMRLEMRALPATIWLEQTGAPFDADAWAALSDTAVAEQLRLEGELTAAAGTADLLGRGTVNWSSPVQVAEVLRRRGHAVQQTDEATLLGLADAEPLAKLLLDYREASKRVSVYGIEYLKHVDATTGRIHADYLQLGAASGRMSCQRPNLQQIPRDPAYRGCFKPGPGRALVKADYGQIELRIAAEVAGDRAMIDAFQRGEDLHALTAKLVLGKTEVTRHDRQTAKALNFGLIYGMGAPRLQEHAASGYGVRLTLEEAEQFRVRFFQHYDGIRRWHRAQPDGPIDTRTVAGRRRLAVEKFTEKLNTPVQGTAADGLKAALALMWETRGRCPGAAPVLCVHDEVVVECDYADAETTLTWLEDCMRRGMGAFLRRVPVVVEALIQADWSGTLILVGMGGDG